MGRIAFWVANVLRNGIRVCVFIFQERIEGFDLPQFHLLVKDGWLSRGYQGIVCFDRGGGCVCCCWRRGDFIYTRLHDFLKRDMVGPDAVDGPILNDASPMFESSLSKMGSGE